MSLRRVFHLVKKESLQVIRDRRLLPLIVIIPIFQLILLGYVISTDVRNISTVVYDSDRSAESRRMVSHFANVGYFNLDWRVSSQREIARLMDEGRADVALVIPSDFSKELAQGRTAKLQIIVDGTDSNKGATALTYALGVVGKESNRIALEKMERMPQIKTGSIDVRSRVWYNPDLRSVNYMVPALIGIILTVTTMILTGISLVREKEKGTLEQLIVTPITRSELILGKLIPFVVLGFIDVVLIIIAAGLWFGIPIKGSVLLLMVLCVVFVFTTLGGGLFVSTISRTQQQAILTAWFFLLPSFLLSGFIFPIANMPRIIQYVTYLIPLRYFLVIIRGIYLKGVGLAILWDEVMALALLGVVIFILSVMRFQKRLVT